MWLLLLILLMGCAKPAPVLVQPDAAPEAAPVVEVPDAAEEPKVLSSYTTTFEPIDGRLKNIQTAADALDGAIVQPFKVFSFNDVVGIRTAKNGYVDAPVLLQGRRTSDLGGGVCQVSSTLHAAAILGGLIIKERRPHSLVPKYIEPGYDATVAFPASCETKDAPCEKLDLKFQWAVADDAGHVQPLTIHAYVDKNTVEGKRALTVWFGGMKPNFKVEFKKQTEPMGRGGRRWVRSGKILTPSYVKVVQQQGEGYFVRTTATYLVEDSESDGGIRVGREFKWFSRYPPVDEVWEVGWARPADAGDPWP